MDWCFQQPLAVLSRAEGSESLRIHLCTKKKSIYYKELQFILRHSFNKWSVFILTCALHHLVQRSSNKENNAFSVRFLSLSNLHVVPSSCIELTIPQISNKHCRYFWLGKVEAVAWTHAESTRSPLRNIKLRKWKRFTFRYKILHVYLGLQIVRSRTFLKWCNFIEECQCQ